MQSCVHAQTDIVLPLLEREMVMPATENPLRKRLEQQTVSPRKDQRPLDFYALTLSGLQHPTEKQLPYPLLYDNHGSEMFEEITAVSEYYPTREERKIIIEKAPHLVSNWSRDTIIVELGCGSASKTRHILEAFAKRHGKVHFIAIDISQTALDFAGKELKDLLGEKLQLTPICADYIDGVQRARNMFPTASMAVLWLGGSVGNMVRHNAASFLSQINRVLHPASMVVGIDVWKAPQLLYGAYHDKTGVTERFIRNILSTSRELDAWRFFGLFNPYVSFCLLPFL